MQLSSKSLDPVSSQRLGLDAPVLFRAKRFRRRAIAAGLVATLFVLQGVPALRVLLSGRDVPLPLAVGACLFLVIPLVLSAIDRLLTPFGSSLLSRSMLGGVVAAFAGGTISVVMWSGAIPRITRDITSTASPAETAFSSFTIGFVLSVLVVGAWALAAVFPRVLEEEKLLALHVKNVMLEAAQLRAQGELTQLRGQLEPHFLLNTLTLISGLVSVDVVKARRTILNLGELLRDALEPHGECQSIDAEIQWLARYGEILSARHGPKLVFEWDIDATARDACIPRLVLQPLVENAIIHGALRSQRKGIVTIRVRKVGARIEIEVADNGPGVVAPIRAGALGIANVRRRLELTRPDANLRLETTPNGTCARLSFDYSRHVPGERV